jgi:hypothetical protein
LWRFTLICVTVSSAHSPGEISIAPYIHMLAAVIRS